MDSADRLRPYVAGLAVAWAQSMPEVRHRRIEGSLAFVDISGFTTLTERLAAKGKVGAEELNDCLDDAFGQLLEVAYSYGALLVKWGGDAVLLLFEGPESARLACRAAYEMQRTMRRIGRLRTSVGTVQLRMSVGISSGAFDFFLVGQRHHELLVTGPAATATAVMEGIAEAGEIVVSRETAALLPARCRGADKDTGVLLRSAPEVDPRCRYWPRPLDEVDPGMFLDPAIRDHLLAEVGESEHRQIAVGFVEVSGVDDLLSRQGPGAVASALHDLIVVVQEECARHRVTFWETDISKDGFKILLVAGAPSSSGRDEDGMIRAARAILDRHDGPVGVRIGVNRGRVFSGAFGPPFRRSWSVKGDAVNLAARVMGKAERGQLLATETLLRRVTSRVEADLLPPFMVKGKKHPVRAAQVHRVTADRVVDEARTGAFVGRRAELDLLLGAARAAAHGSGRGIAVVGEPGVGKSRLADHVCSRVDGNTRVARGFAADYESATPYYAIRRMLRGCIGLVPDAQDAAVVAALRRLVAQSAPDLTEWLPLLAVPFGVQLPNTTATAAVQDEFRRARTLSLVVDFLSRAVSTAAVLVVDDVQHADDASAELLARLSVEALQRPWVVVVVGRSLPPALEACGESQHVELGPLDEEEARALVLDAPGGEELRPHVVRAVLARAGGNPLFLRELIAAVGSVTDDGDLPGSLEELLAARLDDLAPPQRKLLRTVSVLGTRFDEALATKLTDKPPAPEDWQALDEFLARHADGTRRFRSSLVRDTAYEGLPYRRRVELHGRAASALEALAASDGHDRAEALSLHCLAAERYADAWRYAMLAGEGAQRVYANVEALALYDRARAAARHLPHLPATVVAELYEAIGDVHGRLAELDDATRAYREARRRAPQSALLLRARSALRIGLVAERAGSSTSAERWLSTAHRDLRPLGDDPDLAHQAAALDARVSVERAFVQHVSGREASAAKLARRAVELAESVAAEEVVGRGLLLLDVIDLTTGRGSDEDRVMRSLEMFERCGDLTRQASGWNYLGMTAYFRGEWSEAVEAYRRAAEAEQRAGDDYSAAIAWANIGEILVDQGRLDEAEPLVAGALRLWRTSKTPHDIGWGAALLGRLQSRRGRHAEALALFSEALTSYAAKDERFEIVDTQMRIAEALLLQGEATAAEEQLARAMAGLLEARAVAGQAEPGEGRLDQAPVSAAQAATLHRLRSVAAAQLGDRERAHGELERSLAAARAHSSDHDVALSQHIRAWLADDGAVDAAVEKDELFARLGIVWAPAFPAAARMPLDTAVIPRQRAGTDVPV